jgi:hypothetical protein
MEDGATSILWPVPSSRTLDSCLPHATQQVCSPLGQALAAAGLLESRRAGLAAILSLTARPPGVSLPGLTVHDSAPALVVKSGNLAARPVWEGVKGGWGLGGAWPASRGREGTSSPGLAAACGLALTSQLRQWPAQPPTSFSPWAASPAAPSRCPLWKGTAVVSCQEGGTEGDKAER